MEALTLTELRSQAKELGIASVTKYKKDELLNLIEEKRKEVVMILEDYLDNFLINRLENKDIKKERKEKKEKVEPLVAVAKETPVPLLDKANKEKVIAEVLRDFLS